MTPAPRRAKPVPPPTPPPPPPKESRWRPHRAFWTGFTAFFATLITLLGLDQASVITIDQSWLGAALCAIVVAAAEYGRERLAHENGE